MAGSGLARIGETVIADGDVGRVPSDMLHNFRNTGWTMPTLFLTCGTPG